MRRDTAMTTVEAERTTTGWWQSKVNRKKLSENGWMIRANSRRCYREHFAFVQMNSKERSESIRSIWKRRRKQNFYSMHRRRNLSKKCATQIANGIIVQYIFGFTLNQACRPRFPSIIMAIRNQQQGYKKKTPFSLTRRRGRSSERNAIELF